MSITKIARNKLESEHISNIIEERRVHARDKHTQDNMSRALHKIMQDPPRLDMKNFAPPQQQQPPPGGQPQLPQQPPMQGPNVQEIAQAVPDDVIEQVIQALQKRIEVRQTPVAPPQYQVMPGAAPRS